MKFRKCLTTSIWLVMAALIGLLLIIVPQFMTTIIPEVPWRIEGMVLDEATNAIAGATVKISGSGKLTGAHRNFNRKRTAIDLKVITGENGEFSFDFRAAYFVLEISKSGYREEERYFGHKRSEDGEIQFDSTNQTLRIFLEAVNSIGEEANTQPRAGGEPAFP